MISTRRDSTTSILLFCMFVLEMIVSSSSLNPYESPSSSSPYNDYDPLQQPKYLELFNGAEKNNFNSAPSWAEWSSDRERIRFWRWKNRNRLRNIRRAARLGLTATTAGAGAVTGAGDREFRNGRQNLKKKSLPRSGHHHHHPQNRFEYNFPTEKYVMLENMTTDSCCPTQFEVIEPNAGRNRGGHLVELYQDDIVKQHFYEYSCKSEVVDKPCRFLENRHSKQSKCTQLHTYTYALVRKGVEKSESDPGPSYPEDPYSARGLGRGHSHSHGIGRDGHDHTKGQPWALDYIMIRSGCACQIDQGTKKKKRLFGRKG